MLRLAQGSSREVEIWSRVRYRADALLGTAVVDDLPALLERLPTPEGTRMEGWCAGRRRDPLAAVSPSVQSTRKQSGSLP